MSKKTIVLPSIAESGTTISVTNKSDDIVEIVMPPTQTIYHLEYKYQKLLEFVKNMQTFIPEHYKLKLADKDDWEKLLKEIGEL